MPESGDDTFFNQILYKANLFVFTNRNSMFQKNLTLKKLIGFKNHILPKFPFFLFTCGGVSNIFFCLFTFISLSVPALEAGQVLIR